MHRIAFRLYYFQNVLGCIGQRLLVLGFDAKIKNAPGFLLN